MHRSRMLFLLVSIFGWITVGCGGSTSTTLPSGRKVEAVTDTVMLRQKSKGDTAVVEVGGATIVIEPKQVRIDGQTVAEISASTSRVRVARRNGGVTIEADGQVIYDSKNHGLNFGGVRPRIIVQEKEEERVLALPQP